MGLKITYQNKASQTVVKRFYENVQTLEQLRQRYRFIHAGLQFDKDYEILAVIEHAVVGD